MIQQLKPEPRLWRYIWISLLVGFIFGMETTIIVGFIIDPDRFLR